MRKTHWVLREFCIYNFHPLPVTPPHPELPEPNQQLWRDTILDCDWLGLIATHIQYAKKIAEYFRELPTPVLLEHNITTDTQYILGALLQLIEDPYFRTLRGYAVFALFDYADRFISFIYLIEKMFLEFGFPLFLRMTGNSSVKHSPSFVSFMLMSFYRIVALIRQILFLDCVHQLLHQFPVSFEFTHSLLLVLVDVYNSGHLVPYLPSPKSLSSAAFPSLWEFLQSEFKISNHINSSCVLEGAIVPSDMKEGIILLIPVILNFEQWKI